MREAIAMSQLCGISDVWFPPPHPATDGAFYVLNSTVLIDRGPLVLTGNGGASVGFAGSPPQAKINVRGSIPGFLFNYSMDNGVVLRNLNIGGGLPAVKIQMSAGIIFDNCVLEGNSDGNWTAPKANLRLGTDNAALVVVNSFGLTFQHTSFLFNAQQPSVILRGETCCDGNVPGVPGLKASGSGDNCCDGPEAANYLIFFRGGVLIGGVQYQQMFAAADAAIGWFDFVDLTMESSAVPLLDFQSDPKIASCDGMEHVIISNFYYADSVAPTYLSWPADDNLASVVTFNCTQPGCAADGLVLTGAAALGGGYNKGAVGHAVRVYAGEVKSATLLNPSQTGALDIVDGEGKVTGSFVSKSAGGMVFVSPRPKNPTDGSLRVQNRSATCAPPVCPETRGSPHALLVGLPGDSAGRFALDGTGEMRWGDGESEMNTTLCDKINECDKESESLASTREELTALREEVATLRESFAELALMLRRALPQLHLPANKLKTDDTDGRRMVATQSKPLSCHWAIDIGPGGLVNLSATVRQRFAFEHYLIGSYWDEANGYHYPTEAVGGLSALFMKSCPT